MSIPVMSTARVVAIEVESTPEGLVLVIEGEWPGGRRFITRPGPVAGTVRLELAMGGLANIVWKLPEGKP